MPCFYSNFIQCKENTIVRGERSYGKKLIRLYHLLLTAHKWFATRELEISLSCSKQPVDERCVRMM